MKKLIPLILFLSLLWPNIVSAHAELESSQPKQGETVTQSIDTLTLQFGEEIEKFVSFTITNGKSETIPMSEPSISGKTVLVMTNAPLPNGDYAAKWELVATDGHKTSGQLSFRVGQATEKQTQTQEPAKAKTEQQKQTTRPTTNNTLYIGIIIVLVIIILIGLWSLFRKKRK